MQASNPDALRELQQMLGDGDALQSPDGGPMILTPHNFAADQIADIAVVKMDSDRYKYKLEGEKEFITGEDLLKRRLGEGYQIMTIAIVSDLFIGKVSHIVIAVLVKLKSN